MKRMTSSSKKPTSKRFDNEGVSLLRSDTVQKTHVTRVIGSWAPLIVPFLEALGIAVVPEAETAVLVGAYDRAHISSLRTSGTSVRVITTAPDPWLETFLPPEARVPYQSVSHLVEGALLLLGQDDQASFVRDGRNRVSLTKATADVAALMKLARLRHPVLRVPYGTKSEFKPILTLLKTKNPYLDIREDGRVGREEAFPEEGLLNRIFMTSLLWEKYGFVEPYYGDFDPVQA